MQTAMKCRKVVTERQMRAAKLLVDGYSAMRALTQAGYSKWTAHNFGAFLRNCWGLREAIREEQERRREYLTARVAPPRRRRYNRRPVANAVRTYCGLEDRDAVSNTPLHRLHADEQKAKRIAAGLSPKPLSPRDVSFEGKKKIPCGNCGRPVQQDKTFADPTGYLRICPSCAGV